MKGKTGEEWSYVGYDGNERTSSLSRSMATPKFRPVVNMYDFDGVTSEGVIFPQTEHDVIITGRTFQESKVVYDKMAELKISNAVYFNPIHYKDRGDHTVAARKSSGNHKANIISLLKANGVNIGRFWEDDKIQADIITFNHPDVEVILVESTVEK